MRREIARAFPGGPRRSHVFSILGGLAFLTFCLVAFHWPDLQQFTSGRPLGGSTGTAGSKSGMTSLGHDPALTAPRHASTSTITTPRAAVADPTDIHSPTKIPRPEDSQESLKMEYGANKHPPFKDDPPQLIRDLPRELIPSYTPPPTEEPTDGEGKTNAKRLVIVGDVHGHLAALKALLRRIGFDHKHGDHLILAGDMTTKGPNSKGVVRLAMNLSASAVRGNQDDKVLAVARRMGRLSVDDDDGQEANDADEDGQDDEEDGSEAEIQAKRKYRHIRRVARSLTRAQLAWLRSLPIILRIAQLPNATSPPWNASTITVVHGGLVPGTPLEKQDPWAVMNMRSLVYPGHGKGSGKGKHRSTQSESEDDDEVAPDAVAVPIDKHDGEPWSHAWNRYQNNLPPSADHTVVVYGHDAKKGLQVTPQADISPYYSSSSRKNHRHKKAKGLRYAFGLDSGCGHGRQLTGLVIEAGPYGVRHRIEQVECDLETEERALWEDNGEYTPPMPPPPPEDEEEGDGEGEGDENQRVVV